ncbi:IS630 family transposase [Clostridia bacterium]|nr:IS630 family transposase [Clostridia bacterium]
MWYNIPEVRGVKTSRAVVLTDALREQLKGLLTKRTAAAGEVQRAKILLYREQGMGPNAIAEKLDIGRATVFNTLKKYHNEGVESAIKEDARSGRPIIYTDDICTIIINTACMSPKSLGYAQELWTIQSLTNHINSKSFQESHTGVGKVSKSSVERTLQEARIKPFKIKYYCEKRDSEFDQKMKDILLVYKQVQLQLDGNGQIMGAEAEKLVTLSYDEKPGIQAIATTAPDLMPREENGCVMRDAEYKRLGTISLLAAIDLVSGKATPYVSETHTSEDFVTFLKKLDEEYPKDQTLRLILDNHSIHKSKRTMEYLKEHEGRFLFVFTPKHGSWLNLIESFFGKMTRLMLRGIRVVTKDELKERIYKYFDEINETPVVFRWKYKLDEVSVAE